MGGDSACPAVQEYDVLDTDGTTRSTTFYADADTGVSPTSPGYTNVELRLKSSSAYNTEADYEFRVKIYSYPKSTAIHEVGVENFETYNSTVSTDYDGNAIGTGFKWLNLKLHVYCSTTSTVLIEAALPSHGTTIFRPINNGVSTTYAGGSHDTRFTMPSYTSITAACYVEDVEISETYVDDDTFS